MMDGRVSNLQQVASLRRYTLTECGGKGLDIIDCDNGKLRFLLNASKALDVAQLYHGGQNVSFVSKNGLTAREIPFLNRFEGGMLYTCGLDSVGGREGYELHGTLHNTPALITRAACDEQGITVEAEMASTALFGKHLVLKRKVYTAVGSDVLEITDTLENRAYADAEYCLLYHVNVGYPMLDVGAKITLDEERYTPRNDWARAQASDRAVITEPIPCMEETCYFMDLKRPQASLTNEKIGKRFTLGWSQETIPHFVEWKSMACGDYALGLEPCTTELDERFRYSNIKAGESVTFRLSIRVENI